MPSDALRRRFDAMPAERQTEIMDGLEELMEDAEAALVYRVWVGGELMPGPCDYLQVRRNIHNVLNGLEDAGDEVDIRVVAEYARKEADDGD